MAYIVQKKQDTEAEVVFLTTEKTFVSSKGIDQPVSALSSAEAISAASEKVYFQIED